jgi:hypothetical protein
MNTSSTRWLVLMALALGAFIYLYEQRTADTEQTRDGESKLLSDLVASDVTGLDIVRGTNVFLRAERGERGWGLSSAVGYPLLPTGIEKLLNATAQLRVSARVGAQEILAQTNRLAAFGLEPPGAILTLYRGKARTEMRLGAYTLLGRQLYVQVVGRDGLFVVREDLFQLLPNSVDEWRDPALLRLAGWDLDRIEVLPNTNGLEVVRHATNRVWQMTRPLLTRANNVLLDFLLQQLQLARISRFVTDDPRADLEPYGLQPPARELLLYHGSNVVAGLQLGRSPPNDPTQIYVRRLSHSNVVLTARSLFQPWLASFRDFCDRRLMIFSPEMVDQIEVQAAERFLLQRETNGWRLVQPFVAPADSLAALELMANLAELEFTEFEREVVSDFAPFGLAPPKRQYLLRTVVTNAAGVVTNPVIAQVDFGNPVGARVLARRSLEHSVVAAVDPGRLPTQAFQLRDRRIWNFSTNQVAAFTVRQNGQVRRLVRQGPAQWTNAPGSSGVVGSFSLEEAAFRLGQLRAETWVARGADQLARYGIPALDYSVTVELLPADHPQLLTIRFGRNAPSRRPYASVTLPEPLGEVIFECPLSVYDFVLTDLTAVSSGLSSP